MARVLLYFVATLLAGALAAGPLQLVVPAFAALKPETVTSRCLMAAALLLAPLLLLGQPAGVRAVAGLEARRHSRLRQFGLGLALGAASFGPHAVLLVVWEVRPLETGWPALLIAAADALPGALATGLVVALYEELLFRGLIFGAVRVATGPLTAAMTASMLYALAHFLRPEAGAIEPGWTSGLQVVGGGLARFLLPGELADDFLALFLAGLALAWAREISGSIAVCAGLHAAWVAGIKLTKALTDLGTARPWLVGEFDGVIGWLAAAWILALLLAVRVVVAARAGR